MPDSTLIIATVRCPVRRFVRPLILTVATLACLIAAGCGSLLSSMSKRMADNLAAAVLNQTDPETVRQGAPAYLLLADSLIEGDPDNSAVLQTGARLYVAYAAAFVADPERARRLTARAMDYAERALCKDFRAACTAEARRPEGFAAALNSAMLADVPVIYTWGVARAGWIQARGDDWNAIALLPNIEAVMSRVVALDEGYERGAAHVLLGVLATLRPPAFGGKPEQGRRHFERAIELSGGADLMGNVRFARHYARLVFDRPLHDRLLNEVLAAEAVRPGLTLSNTLAKEEARQLLAEADKYF
jgi:TRAP transporter T-component